MSHQSIFGVAGIAFLAVGLGACAPPEKAPQNDEADAVAPQPSQQSAPDQTTGEGVTDSKPAAPAAAAAAAEDDSSAGKRETPTRVFDLLRKGDQLVLSGRIRSELQAKEIAAALQIEGLTLENKLEVDPKTPGIDWGNRVGQLLPPLVATVPDLHFHVEAGVITLTGTVKSERDKNQLQRDIVYVMESPLIRDLKNELKISAGGTD